MRSPENKNNNKVIQKKTGKIFFPVLVVFFVLNFFSGNVQTIFAATGINEQISFQGKVVNGNGTNVANASYNFLFCLYTTSSPATPCTAGSNNDAVWRESKSLTVTDGIFQSNLGDTTTLPGSVDFNTDNIYLGINFNSDGQMSPLVRFTAAPYAMNAAKVGGLTVTDTTGTLTIPNAKTIQFADAFSTTGAFPLTLTSTASTTATLPSGTITLVDLATSQSLTNKTIGSTGLTFSGAATDITTATGEDLTVIANGAGIINLNDSVTTGALTISGATTDITTGTGESLVIVANGAGVVDIQDATTVDSLTADTGGVSIAAGQSYTGAGAVTLSSTTNGLTLDSGNNTLTIAATDTAISATGVATLTLAPNVSITNATGNITLQPAGSSTIANVQIGVGGAGSTTPDYFALDVKSDTGDPAGGFEGAMYYNTLDNKFRCYQGAGWTDCIGAGGSQTPWTSDINAAGYDLGSLSNLGFQETTGAPAGTDVGFYRDNTGDLTANVLTGKTFNLAVNNTDEYNFSSTGLGMNSNNITALGTNLTAADALTIASTTNGLTLDSGNNTLTVAASDTTFSGTGLATITLGTNPAINPNSGTISIGTATATGITLGSASVTSGITVTTGVTTGTGLALTTGSLTTGVGESITSTVAGGAGQIADLLNIAITDSTSSTGGFSGIQITDAAGTGTGTGAKRILDLQVGNTASTFGASGDLIFGSVNRDPVDGFNLLRLQSNTTAGTLGDVLKVNAYGDQLAGFTVLNGTTTANGAGTSATSLVLTSGTNFDVGNYVQVNSTTCRTGLNVCYAKITAKATNTLTITPALTWANGSTINEYHVPEIGGVDTSQVLTNRYGRGYFIGGTVAGDTSTYYADGQIYTSDQTGADSTGLSLFTGTTTSSGNSGSISIDVGAAAGTVGTITIGGTTATSLTIGRSSQTVSFPGNISVTGTISGSAPATGTSGYWSRATTNLTPANSGDNLTGIGNITAAAGLTIATAAGSDLTINSGTTGTINIGTDASAETINIGNTGAAAKSILIGNNTQANTITIGDASVTNLSIVENNWNIGIGGAATFTSVGAGSGTITTTGTIGTASTTTFTGAGGTFSSALAANGGITFDASTDTIGAHTLGGTLATAAQDITGTNFTITGSTGVLALKGGTAAGDLTTMSTAAGTTLNILPSNPSSSGAGVGLVLKGSAGTTTGAGGAVTITAGAAAGATIGGTIGITTGAGGTGGTANSGGLTLATGTAAAGTAGNISIDVGTSSTSNGTIAIGTAARAQTINIGNNATSGTVTTIGSLTNTGLILQDAQWNVTDAGAATFASVSAGSGTITTSGTIGTASTTTFTGAGGTFSSALAANGGITFDASTDTIGAFTAAGNIDMNATYIISNIGSTATDFTTSGALTIGLDAAEANGALIVNNAAQANPIIVAQDNGTMVWQVGDNGLITVDPATTGTIQSFALATQWTAGTVISAAFGSSTTQSAGTMTGIALDLSTNLTTPAAGQNVTGLDVKLPVVSTTSNATVYTGFNLSTAGAVTNATAGSLAWRGANITMPNITQSAGGAVTSSGVLITSGSITTAGTQNMLSLAASGVGAGTLNAINVGTITGGAGAETAINVGTGWDTILGGTTAGTNLISFSNFTVTTAGAGTFASTLNANGGIAFDAASDTVGAHTLSGTINANTNIIENIGNTGTDFVASTGALTLAGVLTANGGITLAGSQTFSASALSYLDLGSIVHNTTAVQGIRLPQAASATPSSPTSGEGYLAWDVAGNQLITYNGSAWGTVGGGSQTPWTGNIDADNFTLTDLGTNITARAGLTIASTGAGDLTLDSATGRTILATGDFLKTSVAGVSGAAAGDIWYDSTANKYKINENGTTKTLCNETDAGCGAGGATTLPTAYGADADNGDVTISLTTADDSIIISNPASSGTDSTFALKVDQLAAGAVDGIQISNAGTGSGLTIDATGTGNLAVFKKSGVEKVTFANNGALTINGADSSIVRDNSTQFTVGTVGSKLINSGGRIEMSDGTPASNVGTINTTSQPVVNAAIGAGSMSISRPNGKYMIINGGAVLTTSIYDPMANTNAITAGPTLVSGNGTGFGAGAIALPRANGMYTIVLGVAGGSTAATSTLDPQGNVSSVAGPTLNIAITGAGTVAYKRPDGRYLVTIGASTPAATTNIFDPVANTFIAGPTAASNWGAGALAIPRPDGTALMVSGGNASTTAIYNPYPGAAAIGAFTVGPKLDGTQAAGTCGVNGGSVAIKRQDGKFIILSKGGATTSAVSALYDPVANTMTCRTSNGPSANLGDGAHAIPLQNGKFLIYAGGNTTTTWIYSQDTDSFATWSGTAPVAITTGAHSIMRTDGTWQTITGTNTCGSSTGCTFNFDTNLPMGDPFPSQVTAGTPTSSGSCTAGDHSYYVTFYNGSTESELSNKSNVVSCTASNGTVALTNIPLGPLGTTARRIYRTPTGDVGAPQLVGSGTCVLSDNTTTTCSDTLADASLGAAYSVTAATTWYTTEDISSTALSPSSTLRWNAQLEAVYAANRNTVTNTAFKVMQFFVKTAVNNSGCATPLANASWQEVQNSGDLIHTVAGANCVKVSVHFNRAMPKRLFDDRGVWFGNGSTLLRYDYVTPTLFSIAIDNSSIIKRYAFDFSSANSNEPANATIPAAPSSAAPGGSGSCTSGNHYWFVTFVTNSEESLLSPASTVRSCSGSDTETLTLVAGPSGTTARKIYRTKAGDVATDTPFYVGTVSDNSTTTFVDSLADSSLGAAFVATTPSGPVLSRGESSRVELVNNQLTLPWGRITPTSATATTLGLGNFYMGAFGADHPMLNNLAGIGTMVLARDDKTFLVIEAGNASGTADLYDPVTQTFTNQADAGDRPTAATASGAFAIKRPNGKFLVVLGTGITTTTCTTSGTATNIYDQYAPPGSRFTNGPCLSATAGQGAFAIQNADGTFTILHGNAQTATTIYDPVRNTMTSGPVQTTGTNVGGLAIPLAGPMNNNYKIIVGTTLGGAVATTTMNYNANTKIFTAGANLTTAGSGSGAYAFQRADGWWILVKGTAGVTTSIINPYNGVDSVGPVLIGNADRGGHVIPRADGTFLNINGNAAAGLGVVSSIYFPWGGALAGNAGATLGSSIAGPNLVLPGGAAPGTAPVAGTATAGGAIDAGTHSWKITFVTNGVESQLSAKSNVLTIVGGTQTTAVTGIAGPTGTTARKVYRTKVGDTGNYFYVGTINDNTPATAYTDAVADSTLTIPFLNGGPGDGALSFQRPDGKYVTIFAGSVPSKTTNIYDAGWYSDGQYMSEQMNVPAMAANSTLDWQQTPDQYVRMEVRSASSQTALSVAGSNIVSNPGGSIGNALNDTWLQVTVNFRRDFPTWSGALNGVYVGTGGMTYPYRQIPMPTVNSFQITNGMDLMTLQNNGLNVLRVTSNGNIMSSTGGGFFSGGADLAENYTSTQALDKGEVVMIDRNNPQGVVRSTGQYESNVLGVVSTAPGFVAGGYTQDSYPIALVGRVPVRISTENGPILTGDYLTAASIPGYAMRATQAGRALGRALESFDETTAVTCPSQGLGNDGATKCGSVMMFVNLTDYFGMPVDVVMTEQNASEENSDGIDIATADMSTDTENGLRSSAVRLAMSAPTKEEKTLAYLIKLRDDRLSGKAMPASEIFTDRIAASTSVTTPTLVADQIFARSIKADSIEGLQIWTDQIASLQEKYAGLESITVPVTTETGVPTAPPALSVAMKNFSTDSITVQLDGTILGKLSVEGALRIGGDAEFAGNTVFGKLATFLDRTLFKGKVDFEKAPTFGSDTAGFALIEKGARRVHVNFDEAYEEQPIVAVTLTNDKSPLLDATDEDLKADVALVEADYVDTIFSADVRYIVTEKDKTGFTIVLGDKAPYDIQFSWVAIAVRASKTSVSEKEETSPSTNVLSETPAAELPVAAPLSETSESASSDIEGASGTTSLVTEEESLAGTLPTAITP